MSVTYAIKGVCLDESIEEVLRKMSDICSDFGWEYNNARSDGYSTEPGHYVWSDKDGASSIDEVINRVSEPKFLAVTISKEVGGSGQSARIVLQSDDPGISLYVSYDRSVLAAKETEKYLFLNIMIGVILCLKVTRLYYSTMDSTTMPEKISDNKTGKLMIADATYIPSSSLNVKNSLYRSLPPAADLIKVGDGYLLLCCQRLFCSAQDRRRAAEALDLCWV